MTRKFRNLLLAATLPIGVAACGGGGGGGGNTGTTPPTTPATAFTDKFGSSFSAAINTSATADPKDPAAADVPALNASADAIDN